LEEAATILMVCGLFLCSLFGILVFFYLLCSMKRILLLLIACVGLQWSAVAQTADFHKMSAMVRRAVIEQRVGPMRQARSTASVPRLCAFVRISGDADAVLRQHDCRKLAQWGDICVADIPLNRLAQLSKEQTVSRIEARESCRMTLDTTAVLQHVRPVWQGEQLPQAFTGRGVVVGVQDVGFDLTHPTFYNKELTNYRIRRFWDQLSADTLGSGLYVGADYQTEAAILGCARSRDASIITHGTHTAGIAAGSGYDTDYRGMAWESDLCLVSNAVTEDTVFIDKQYYYKYTSATDALGFQYIFDYAASVGKPCVVSFSEGSHQSFWHEDQLLHEAIARMTGPGRIFVASAGNEGHLKTYVDKPGGVERRGTFLESTGKRVFVNLRSDGPFTLRTTVYEDGQPYAHDIQTADVCQQADSMWVDTVRLGTHDYTFTVVAYPAFYDQQLTACELYISTDESFGKTRPVSVEMVGSTAHVEMFKSSGTMTGNACNAQIDDAVSAYSIYSPGCAQRAVCVGGMAYRSSVVNYRGETRVHDGRYGHEDCERYHAASIGPTFDNRVKPDVTANAVNVISAYGSYYIEQNPNAWDTGNDVAHFQFNGRTYGWNASTGTSMSTPVVAGAIALWLQACPSLTPEDVKGILERTCRKPDAAMSYPNNYYGYGEIDIYKGLLDILNVDGIEGISDHQPRQARFRLTADGELQVIFDTPEVPDYSLHLYSPAGICLTSSHNESLHVGRFPHGLYVVQLRSHVKGIEGSTLIRL